MKPILLSKLALGSVQFGINYGISNIHGKTSADEVHQILKLAESYSINTIDTSYNYGNSENVLGLNSLSLFNIVSKYPHPIGNQKLNEILQVSLDRLHLQSLYGWLCHDPEKLIANPEQFLNAKLAQEKGLVKKLGFSVYSPEQLNKLITHHGVPDIIQVPFNLLDRRFEDLIVNLQSKGTEVHIRSVFLQGVFILNPEKLPDFFNPIKNWLNLFHEAFPSIEQRINAALKFCLIHPFIDKSIIGINTLDQLQMNIRVLDIENTNIPEVPTDLPLEILNPSMWPKI